MFSIGDKVKFVKWLQRTEDVPYRGIYCGINFGSVLTITEYTHGQYRFKEISGIHHHVEDCFKKVHDKYEIRVARMLAV